MLLISYLNSINTGIKDIFCNRSVSRNANYFTNYLKKKYEIFLRDPCLSIKILFEDNEEIVKEFIEIIVNKKYKTYSTFNSGLTYLITYYQYLSKRNIINKEYLEKIIELILSYKKRTPVITREDSYIAIGRLNRIVRNNNIRDILRFKAVIYFVYYTGIVRNEFYSIKREDFDLERCSVKILNRVCYYPIQIRDMIKTYFDSEIEIKNAFNLTNAVMGRFNRILSKYSLGGRKIDLTFLRYSNANMIMRKTKNPAVLMNLHGKVNKSYVNKYRLTNEETEVIYKHYVKPRY